MGRYDSSKTRVRPILGTLWASDPTGESWLRRLMGLGGRSPASQPGGLVRPPQFEFAAPPPRDFLLWLVRNPKKWLWPEHEMDDETVRKRQALRDGHSNALAEAVAAIETAPVHQRKWWCFEGFTRVDCAFFTETMALFIEGKRTEDGPAPSVSWYQERNQILRLLDCARWYGITNGVDYYVLLVIEDGDPKRKATALEAVHSTKMDLALPHLSASGRIEAMKHYLGVATWSDVVGAFDLPKGLLDEVPPRG